MSKVVTSVDHQCSGQRRITVVCHIWTKDMTLGQIQLRNDQCMRIKLLLSESRYCEVSFTICRHILPLSIWFWSAFAKHIKITEMLFKM